MTWTSPPITREMLPDEGDERTLLTRFLDFHRETFLWKCSELTGDELASRPLATTGMSLLGLIRHLTDVERHWLREVAVGERVTFLYWDNPDRDTDFDEVQSQDAERDFGRYLAEIEICRANQGIDLEATVTSSNGEAFTFRWILIHLIEEYARHNGHADLIREAIDGATGE